ncbi:MAG: glycosyltransferase [Thermoguttaceae bacterium]
MAHFAIICPDLPGHLLPDGRIGVELAKRGHEVTLLSGFQAALLAEEMGLKHHELDTSGTPDGGTWGWLLWKVFSAMGAGWIVGQRKVFRWHAWVMMNKVLPLLKDLRVDGLLLDNTVLAGGTVAERLGVPYVTIWGSPPFLEDPLQPPAFTGWPYAPGLCGRLRNRAGYAGWRWFLAPTLHIINRFRKDWGLPRYRHVDQPHSPLAQISQLFPEFDYPRSRMPACFHYVGSLTADRPSSPAGFPWEKLDGRPLVFTTLGTVADPANRPVYPKIAAACAGLNAQLVLARGKWTGEAAGGEDWRDLPGDPLVVDYAPQLAILDRAALMITHCGMNSTLECISRGVPMVALPRSADQPGNAVRIQYAGAGLRGSFHHGTPEDLRNVIRRVLTDDSFRCRAQQLQAAMKAAGGAPRAAEICEQALLTRQPVLRS